MRVVNKGFKKGSGAPGKPETPLESFKLPPIPIL